jgi:ABC-2 type transport system permease protein
VHKILMVIRREYLDRVRKKSFWVGILIFPFVMGLFIVLPMLLVGMSPDEQRTIAFVDATGKLAAPLTKELADEKLKDGRPRYVLESQPVKGSVDEARKALEPAVARGDLFGILTVGDELNAKGNYHFYGKNVGNIVALKTLENALEKSVVGLRMERMQVSIDRAELEKLTARIDIESFQVTEGGKTRQKGFLQTYMGTFFFVFVLFVSLLFYGVAVMRGILEEKSNRIMEVLLGSLTPNELMTGKILGIGLVGLTQLSVYLATAVVVQIYLAAGKANTDWAWIGDLLSPMKMVYFVIFFVFGYFMYTALFAAVGAVCNSEQEAQNLQAPVQWTLMIPMISTMYFVNNPDSTVATVVSLIPIFSPMVMFMRISLLTPPFWQIALSIVLMAGTTFLIFRGVAKIFRIGVLMYGKRPSIPEILRWARS